LESSLARDIEMSRFSLKGRTALVTGGARGCGLAFAEGLAEAGADVAIFDVIDPVEAFFDIEKKFNVKTKHYKSVQDHLKCSCKTLILG